MMYQYDFNADERNSYLALNDRKQKYILPCSPPKSGWSSSIINNNLDLLLTYEIPGVTIQNLNLSIMNNVISFVAKRTDIVKTFADSFIVNYQFDHNDVVAWTQSGILKIMIPLRNFDLITNVVISDTHEIKSKKIDSKPVRIKLRNYNNRERKNYACAFSK